MLDAERVINHLQDIQAWKPLRRLLKEKELPTGGSWSDLRSALAATGKDTVDILVQLYEQLRLCGRKHVYFFMMPDPDRENMLRADVQVEQSPFVAVYPFPAEGDEFLGPRLTKIIEDDKAKYFVFCSHRRLDAQIPLEVKYLRDDAPESIRSSRIRIFQRQRKQACDIVVVPKQAGSFIEIRIDNFDCSTEPKYTEALFQLKLAVNKLFGDKTFNVHATPVNLQPVMDAIYSDPDEGKITELEFISPSGSYKKESLRMKNPEDDLRVEAFHLAGKTAVKTIGIFRLGVIWYQDDGGKELEAAELLLPGTVRTLDDHLLYEARITHMTTQSDYAWIIRRMTKILRDSTSGDNQS